VAAPTHVIDWGHAVTGPQEQIPGPQRVERRYSGDQQAALAAYEADRRQAEANGWVVVAHKVGPDGLSVLYGPRPAHAPWAPTSGWVVPKVQTGPAPGYAYVGFWRRFWAFLLDGLIIAIPTWLILVPLILNRLTSTDLSALSGQGLYVVDPTTGQLVESPQAVAALNAAMVHLFSGAAIVWLGIFVLQLLYFTIFWSRRGATPAQQLLGIQIRNEQDGSRISFKRALLRYVGYIISIWILYIGFIWVAFDSRKQGWHDKIGGTVAVRRVG